MLSIVRHSQRKFWRGWLTVLAGVWLYAALAPCVSAATSMCGAGPCPALAGDADASSHLCDMAQSIDCQTPDPQPTSLDFTFTGITPSMVLTRTEPAVRATLDRSRMAHADSAARDTPPPLSLRPAVLLI